MVKIFLDNAANLSIDISKEADNGLTAFHVACFKGYSDVVKTFLENATALSIDLNVKGNYGKTAFELACSQDHKNVVEVLMSSAAFKKKLKYQDFKMVTSYYPLVFMGGRKILDIWGEF